MDIFLKILPWYMCFNMFFAGTFFEADISWGGWRNATRGNKIWFFIVCLFGFLLLIISLLWDYVLVPAGVFIDRITQITFWWLWIFTDRFEMLSLQQLQEMNEICDKNHTSGSLRDRHARYIVKLINKKNDYLHTTQKK